MNKILISLVILLTGCAVGPDYQKPVTIVPVAWATASSDTQPSQTNNEEILINNWWETFNDPILTSLIQRAEVSNLDLKQAVSRIRQARASRQTVSSRLFPSINASVNYQESDSDFNTTSTSGLFQSGLDASWELDVFGGIRRGIESADAEIIVQEENRNDILITMFSEVALNYLALRGFQQELLITNLNLVAQRRSAEVTGKLFNAGFRGKLDFVNAEAQVATTESQIPSLEANIQKTIYTLSVLLAQEPNALTTELTPPGNIPPVPAEISISLPSELLRRRPDIRQAEATLQSATAQIGVAVADLFPKFTLNGSVAVQSTSASGLTGGNNSFWSFGPGASLPIFNAGRLRANVKIQKEIQEQALLEYEKTVLNALKEVNSALVDYQQEQNRRQSLEIAVNANLQAVTIAEQLYNTGQTDFLNVLTAQRSLYSSQSALVQSTRTIDTNLVTLYKALGGGWEKTS